MAFGGLLDVLTTPVAVDDGWGGSLDMTHRAYVLTVGIAPDGFVSGPVTTTDPVVATVRVFIGKVLDGEFKAHPGIAVQTATFTRAEVKALGTVTIAGLLTAAKAQLQILE
jgi:hypothetical protein